MKKLIAIIFLAILTDSLNAQLPTFVTRPRSRIDSNSSNHLKSPISFKGVASIDKPTLDSCIYEVYDTSNGTWIKGFKEEFKYNPSDIPTLSFSYYWDPESNKWIPEGKIEVEFNAIGNLILIIYSEYSGGKYNPYLKREIIYNDNVLILEEIESEYQSGTLYIQNQLIYEYDGNGYIKSISHYNRKALDQQWVYKWKYEYTVDNIGRIIEELLTEIDYDRNADGIINFRDWGKTNYIYSTEGNLISIVANTWDNVVKNWYAISKSEATYNAKGQKLTEKYFDLNNDNDQFELTSDDEWIYDSNGNNTAFIIRDLDIASGEWMMEKEEFEFDLLALAKNFSLPYAPGFEWVNKPIGFRFYDEFNDPEWNLVESGTLYYSNNIINNVSSSFQSKLTCLQHLRNFTFSWDTIDEFLTFEVYNLAGQIVYNKRVNKNQTTTLENLSDGLYLYRLSNNKMAITGKILLK